VPVDRPRLREIEVQPLPLAPQQRAVGDRAAGLVEEAAAGGEDIAVDQGGKDLVV
jgi:hypothetical protein